MTTTESALTWIVTESALPAPADAVWAWVTTPAGVNDELAPLVRMTVPRGWQGGSIADVAPGSHLGRSWLLLGGLVPFEFDDLTIAEVGPGCRFVERSTMAAYTRWVHEREVRPTPEGCTVRDRVAFRLRRPLRWLPGLARIHRSVITRLFRHRHDRLTAQFDRGRPWPGTTPPRNEATP